MKSNNDVLLEEFTPEQIQKLDEIIDAYRGKPGGLIPVLERAQELLGFLPVPIQPDADGYITLPDSPGLGVEIDWQALESVRIDTGTLEAST